MRVVCFALIAVEVKTNNFLIYKDQSHSLKEILHIYKISIIYKLSSHQ